jgi:FlaA1/EpsC-like NDP-sugar epimerase
VRSIGNLRKLPPIRNRYFFVADLLMVPLAASLSFMLRLDATDLVPFWGTLLTFAVLATAVKPAIFFLSGLYRHYWRYASTRELISIALTTLAGTAAVTLLMYSVVPLVFDFHLLPRSIPFIDWLVTLTLIGSSRFAVRLLADFWSRLPPDHLSASHLRSERRVLVMGAGDAGAMIVREMRANPGLGLAPIGLLDDNQTKVGMTIHGVPVRGTREDIPSLVAEEQADEVIIAMPTAPGQAIREIVAICQEAGVACRTMPGMYELISGQVTVKQVREVRIEDLLRRDPVRIEGHDAASYLEDRIVLVTGAGGSIGSEICRQIATYRPRRLLLLGHGETSIYHILMEMRREHPAMDVQPLIADIRDEGRLEALFAAHSPRVVFHAAAHKHVPLMERNVAEAVTNNVFGTRRVLWAAERHGVERFVLISTDKAVNPANVMGATKRVAELLVQEVAQRTGRAFVAVRFGNVLGSRGSVVPLFQRQIAEGGPVTVTHPEVERYFMTIPEAVQLVIQAGALGQGGEVFVLDMGEQVRVVDLAEALIRLNGLVPGQDIDIVFVGLRPGEKLSEELFATGEKIRRTRHEKLFVANGAYRWNREALVCHLQELEKLVLENDAQRTCSKIGDIVPEYQPDASQAEVLPEVANGERATGG